MTTGESRDSSAGTDSQATARLERENAHLRALLVQSGIDARHTAEAVSLANSRTREFDELRAESERAHQIIDSMFTFVGMLAPDGKLIEANNASLAAAGLSRSDVIGKLFWDCYWWNYDPAVQERLRAAFDRAVRGEVVRYEETIRVANDGRAVLNFILKPVFDGGRLLFVIPSAEDITEGKAAQATLRDRQETISRQLAEINSIYASARVGLAVLDRDLRYLRVNDRLAEINGVSVGDHIGRTMFEVTPGLAAFATNMAERVIENGESILDVETSGETAAQPGVTRTWVAQWLPLRDPEGSVVGANVVVEEVTQQKRDFAELQLVVGRLRESEARFRAAVDAIDGIVWTANALGEMVGEQADWSSLTGQTPAESEGAGWAQALHPDDAQPTLDAWSAAVAAKAPYAVEHRLRRHDGQWRHFSVQAIPIFDGANDVLQWVGVHRDITERKDREAHIELLMGEVNHRSKNLLAVVMAVANRTGVDVDQATFMQRFSQRIQSLAIGQDLLVKNQWKGILLANLVDAQLGHFKDLIGGRIAVDGGAVHVSPAAAQTIGMALHELATNASKYGALSTERGRVAIAWQLVDSIARGRRLIMSWTESDGPPVVAPTRLGFGSTVIGRLVKSSFDCEVTTDFARSGFSWRLDCPAEKVIEANLAGVAAGVEIGRELSDSGG